VLPAKTLTSSTFKLALIAIETFGVIASANFGWVYLSTSSYVRGRTDRAIMTDEPFHSCVHFINRLRFGALRTVTHFFRVRSHGSYQIGGWNRIISGRKVDR
jgi:hypothetical protein